MKTIDLSHTPEPVQPPADLQARIGVYLETIGPFTLRRYVDLQFLQKGNAVFALRLPDHFSATLALNIAEASGIEFLGFADATEEKAAEWKSHTVEVKS